MITPLFHAGQRVLCVNDNFSILLAQDPRIITPEQDQVYTIRQSFTFLHDVGVTLEEIDNTMHKAPRSKIEPNFSQSRFRLANEQQLVKTAEEIYEDTAVAA